MNKQREKLIELIIEYHEAWKHGEGDWKAGLADHILADGWRRPPCKVGDTVYEWDYDLETDTDYVIESHVCGFAIMTEMGIYPFRNFGKTLFLSREDAEKALKGVE